MVKPIVVLDGQVVGTWSVRDGVSAFRPLAADAIAAERADVDRFLTST
jgi:hypothetical protein